MAVLWLQPMVRYTLYFHFIYLCFMVLEIEASVCSILDKHSITDFFASPPGLVVGYTLSLVIQVASSDQRVGHH